MQNQGFQFSQNGPSNGMFSFPTNPVVPAQMRLGWLDEWFNYEEEDSMDTMYIMSNCTLRKNIGRFKAGRKFESISLDMTDGVLEFRTEKGTTYPMQMAIVPQEELVNTMTHEFMQQQLQQEQQQQLQMQQQQQQNGFVFSAPQQGFQPQMQQQSGFAFSAPQQGFQFQ